MKLAVYVGIDEMRNAYKILIRKLDLDGKTVLKWILQKWSEMNLLDSWLIEVVSRKILS
jgi:hypothetical protein